MLVDASVHTMLDALVIEQVSLHTAYHATGGNEIAGGTYARQTAVYDAAASRARPLNGTESFTGLPAAAQVAWIGRWKVTGGSAFHGMAPNGANPKTFQVDVADDRLLLEGHGFSNGQTVVVYGGTAPTGLTIGTVYYVVGATSEDPDYCQLAATAGGSAINITGQPGAGCVLSPITIEVYGGANGTFTLSGDSVSLPGVV